MSDENNNKLVIATVSIPVTYWGKTSALENDLNDMVDGAGCVRTGLRRHVFVDDNDKVVREEVFGYEIYVKKSSESEFLKLVERHRESMRQGFLRWSFGAECGYVRRPNRD